MTTPTIIYPLEDVLQIKCRRLEKAEDFLKQRRKELEEEQKKLLQAEAERDRVKQHHHDKLTQLRQAFDQGTTSDEVLMMKNYLKVVKEDLQAEEEKVDKQKAQVKQAEDNLEVAREDVRRRRVEVDKMEMHKSSWIHLMKEELRKEEEKNLDEIGNILYLKNKERWK